MSDKIAEIRARHQRGMKGLTQTHHDRATLLAEVERLTRERDEARAEVENLYDQVHRWVDDRAKAQSQADRLREQNYELQRQRNEARAEVEQLTRELNEARAALKASSCAYPDCVDLGPDGKCTKWLLGKCDPTLEAKP
jgi:uncharacterized coiled-coil DUF342 family protein